MNRDTSDPAPGTAAKSAAGLGILAALLASMCCVGPAVLAIFGLGGAAAVLSLSRHHAEFMILAGVLLAAGVYVAVRRRVPEGGACCAAGPRHAARGWRSALLHLAIFAAAYGLINFVLLPAFYARAESSGVRQAAAAPDPAAVREVTLAIEGMTCEACTSHIKSELARVPGVQSARVQYREKRAVVSYDSSRTSADRLQRAVEAAGYRSSRLPAGTQQK